MLTVQMSEWKIVMMHYFKDIDIYSLFIYAFSILNRSISINDNSSLTCSTNLHLFTGMENLQGVPKKVLFRKIAKPLIK